MMKCSNYSADDVIHRAGKIADYALDRFKSVDDTPTMPNLDIQGLVDRVVKDSKKK
jgi:hypothetical protein